MDMTKFNLNIGFMKPDEVKSISDRLDEISKNEKDVNIERVAQLLWSFKAMAYTVRGKGVGITYKLFDPTSRMGSVNIIGKQIDFVKPELFVKIGELASNFEVYPKTDGTVQINFTFHGLRRD